VRALVDENVAAAVIGEMKARGWDVLSLADSAKLRGKDDQAIHRLAVNWNRLLVTADPDFANDRRFPLQDGPGILLLVGDNPRQQLLALLAVVPVIQYALDMERDVLPWNKWIASASRIRLRGKCTSGESIDDVIWERKSRR